MKVSTLTIMITKIKDLFKKNKLLHLVVTIIKGKDLRVNYFSYLRKKSYMKSAEVVRRELKLIKDYWNCPPYHYYRYKLYEKNLTREQLLDYVPPFYFYNYHMPAIYEKSNLLIIEDKILAHIFFTEKEIPTAKEVAYVRQQKIFDQKGVHISLDGFIALLKHSNADRFFIKPAKGKGGAGIFVITKRNRELEIDGVSLFEKHLLKRFNDSDYIIQEGIIQRPDISIINQSSVNTLRIITQINDGKPYIAVAVLRIGRDSMFVDNSTKGGISAEINIETGRLNKYAYTEHDMQVFERHPDTQVVFDNYVITDWDNIKNKIYEYADKLKEYSEIAWDIAIGIDAVYVIEVNAYYGLDHLQCCAGGMGRRLHIR